MRGRGATRERRAGWEEARAARAEIDAETAKSLRLGGKEQVRARATSSAPRKVQRRIYHGTRLHVSGRMKNQPEVNGEDGAVR